MLIRLRGGGCRGCLGAERSERRFECLSGFCLFPLPPDQTFDQQVEILLAGALLPRHRTVGEAMAMASQHERVRAGNKPLLTFRVVPTAPRQQQQQGGAGRAAAGGGARSRAAPQPARAASAATAASEEQPDAPPSVPQLRANAAVMRIVRKVRTDPTSLGTSLQQLAAADRPAFNLIQVRSWEFELCPLKLWNRCRVDSNVIAESDDPVPSAGQPRGVQVPPKVWRGDGRGRVRARQLQHHCSQLLCSWRTVLLRKECWAKTHNRRIAW